MRAELVFIGTELLLGETLNANAQFLGRRLADLGINVFYHATVGDNMERMLWVLQQAATRADIIICTGGLGPTQDDLTRDAIAQATGRPLVTNDQIKQSLTAQLHSRGLEATANQFRQAQLPIGAVTLPNPHGTAPGVWLEADGRVWVALPGPPREMQAMFEAEVVPRLQALAASRGVLPLFRRVLKVVGLPEAVVEDRLNDLIARQVDPTIAPYAHAGEIHLRLATKAPDYETAAVRWEPIEDEIRQRLGWHCYGADEDTLVSVIAQHLLFNNWRLAAGESCTGGLLAAKITDLPGSSRFFNGAVVAYANEVKQSLLSVPGKLLEEHGAVSEPVALAMAEGARQAAKADIGVGITGIAGPGGGTEEKPVGTVFVAVAGPHGSVARLLQMNGTRSDIRERTTTRALTLLLEYLMQ